jgi:hypothetical protein
MKVFFYKAIRPGVAGIYSHGVRLITKSQYSHCEILFSNGRSWSSSFADGGVREKVIEYDPEHWDCIELPDELFEERALKWFVVHQGEKYDLLGNLHFIFSVVGDDKKKWFCSEAVGAALGLPNPWRFDPGTLYQAVKWLAESLDKNWRYNIDALLTA